MYPQITKYLYKLVIALIARYRYKKLYIGTSDLFPKDLILLVFQFIHSSNMHYLKLLFLKYQEHEKKSVSVLPKIFSAVYCTVIWLV